jgi:antitoxin component YwqK of YwqJK toxin-antitoxin module
MSSDSHSKRRRIIFPSLLIGLFSVLALGTIIALSQRSFRVSSQDPTLTLNDVELVEGRLMQRNRPGQPFTGWLVEHYPDGSLKSRSMVRDGKLNGISQGWYPDGSLQIEEHFIQGVANGLVTRWHANSRTLSEATARDGRLHGVYRRWHTNGQLAEEITYTEGKPHRLSRAWFPNGKLKAEVQLGHGKVLHQQFWPETTVAELSAVAGPTAK